MTHRVQVHDVTPSPTPGPTDSALLEHFALGTTSTNCFALLMFVMSISRRLLSLRRPLLKTFARISAPARSTLSVRHLSAQKMSGVPTLYQTVFPEIPRKNGIAKVSVSAPKGGDVTVVKFHTKEQISAALGGGENSNATWLSLILRQYF